MPLFPFLMQTRPKVDRPRGVSWRHENLEAGAYTVCGARPSDLKSDQVRCHATATYATVATSGLNLRNCSQSSSSRHADSNSGTCKAAHISR
jgi:hypothetical protein